MYACQTIFNLFILVLVIFHNFHSVMKKSRVVAVLPFNLYKQVRLENPVVVIYSNILFNNMQ